jgi:hypothetical protein
MNKLTTIIIMALWFLTECQSTQPNPCENYNVVWLDNANPEDIEAIRNYQSINIVEPLDVLLASNSNEKQLEYMCANSLNTNKSIPIYIIRYQP